MSEGTAASGLEGVREGRPRARSGEYHRASGSRSTNRPVVPQVTAVVRSTVRKRTRRVVRGLERRFARRRVILMYHRIASTGTDPWGLAVPTDVFDDQIGILCRRGAVARLGEVVRHDAALQLRRRGELFAITFDDGYSCNLHDALPILERYGAPATIFVPTALVGAPYFWWDRLAWTLLDSGQEPAAIVRWWCRRNPGSNLSNLQELGAQDILSTMYEQIVLLPPDQIVSLLDELSADLGIREFEAFARPVDEKELLQLHKHPLIDIGNHTAHHRRLPHLDASSQLLQMTECTVQLERTLGSASAHLAYPFGQYDQTTMEAAAAAGFDFAVTTESGSVSLRSDRYRLPRAVVPSVPSGGFEKWLAAVPAP